jgi:hypothetical protein
LRYLPAGIAGCALELGAQLPLGNGDTFLLEIGPHLVDDIVISGASKSAAMTVLA